MHFRRQSNCTLCLSIVPVVNSSSTLAIECFHSLTTIYRDLKPENCVAWGWGPRKSHRLWFEQRRYHGQRLSQDNVCIVDWYSVGALVDEMLAGLPPCYTHDHDKLVTASNKCICNSCFMCEILQVWKCYVRRLNFHMLCVYVVGKFKCVWVQLGWTTTCECSLTAKCVSVRSASLPSVFECKLGWTLDHAVLSISNKRIIPAPFALCTLCLCSMQIQMSECKHGWI